MTATINWDEYVALTHDFVNNDTPPPPYDNPEYHQYTKMNETRMKRWIKTNPITEATISVVKQIDKPQQWVVISEPWCGDAAHTVPIMYLMSQLNDKITFEIQLRDSGSEIEKYLTNGSKSIPILIVRDENGKDLFQWGPRPKSGQAAYLELVSKGEDHEAIKAAIQSYYNADKSISTQQEISTLLQAITSSNAIFP